MRLWTRSVHKSAACEKVKKNAMSLANTNRDMNNSRDFDMKVFYRWKATLGI